MSFVSFLLSQKPHIKALKQNRIKNDKMTKTLKLLFICFLSLSVLSFKTRLRQVPGEMAPPGADQRNATAAAAEANATQLPPAQANATEQPQVPQAPEANVTQPELPQAPEANVTQPELPQAPEANVTQPELPQAPQANITLPQLPQAPEGNVTQPEQIVGGAAGLPPSAPSAPLLPSTTVVNTNSPVVSVSGEAVGALQSDLIKIGVLLENQGARAGEAYSQNEQKVKDLIAKLKGLGLKDENILNLGVMFNLQKKLKQSPADIQANQTNNQSNQLFATSQLEIQVNDVALAGKVIDLINSQNFDIKYIDYNYLPDTLNYAVNMLTENALADAEKRARGAIANTGNQLGKLLNLNVEVDKDFQNYMNYEEENREGAGLANPQGMKVIKVIVAATYALQGGQAPEAQPQPAAGEEAVQRVPPPSEIEGEIARNATQPIEARNATAPIQGMNATQPIEGINATAPAGNFTAAKP